MPVSDLLVAGLKLMGMGMGIVFSFLVLLVYTMKAMSHFAAKFHVDEPQSTTQNAVRTHLPAAPAKSDEQLVAVISAAISRFRGATH
ncbi:MAG: OadG family protein [Candidatus Polarisedimenticolaceae bacterium]|nr:OadG family protein [Candidatus Polarisedimenticolaceae bacterium]